MKEKKLQKYMMSGKKCSRGKVGELSSAVFTGAEIGPRCENRSRIMARD